MSKCNGCARGKCFYRDETVVDCPRFWPTNADRIRGMSDEELARQNVRKRRGYCVWTTSDGREFTSYSGFGGVYRADGDTIALAVQHELDWLQKPAETEGTE